MSNPNAVGSNPSGSLSIMNLCGRMIFDGSNFNNWIRNIWMVTRYKDKEYILDKELKEVDEATSTPEENVEYRAHQKDVTKVSCVMLANMRVEPQKSYEDYYPLKMHQDLMERYHQSPRQERYDSNKNEGWRIHHYPLPKDAKVCQPLAEVECQLR